MKLILGPAELRQNADQLASTAAELSATAAEIQKALGLIGRRSATVEELIDVANRMVQRSNDLLRRAAGVEDAASRFPSTTDMCKAPDLAGLEPFIARDLLDATDAPYGAEWIAEVGYLRMIGDRRDHESLGWTTTHVHFVLADHAGAVAAGRLNSDGWPIQTWDPVSHPVAADPAFDTWVEAFAQEIEMRHREYVATAVAEGLSKAFFASTALRVEATARRLTSHPGVHTGLEASSLPLHELGATTALGGITAVGSDELTTTLGISEQDFIHDVLGENTTLGVFDIYRNGAAVFLVESDTGAVLPTGWEWPGD